MQMRQLTTRHRDPLPLRASCLHQLGAACLPAVLCRVCLLQKTVLAVTRRAVQDARMGNPMTGEPSAQGFRIVQVCVGQRTYTKLGSAVHATDMSVSCTA